MPFLSVISHNSETSDWKCIKFGSQGDVEVIHSSSHVDLGVTLCDLSVTLTAFGVNGCQLFGMEGLISRESRTEGLYSGIVYF